MNSTILTNTDDTIYTREKLVKEIKECEKELGVTDSILKINVLNSNIIYYNSLLKDIDENNRKNKKEVEKNVTEMVIKNLAKQLVTSEIAAEKLAEKLVISEKTVEELTEKLIIYEKAVEVLAEKLVKKIITSEMTAEIFASIEKVIARSFSRNNRENGDYSN
jgi:hypothetical protein